MFIYSYLIYVAWKMCIRPPVQPAETKLLDRCVVEVVLKYCSSTTDPPDGGDILKGQKFPHHSAGVGNIRGWWRDGAAWRCVLVFKRKLWETITSPSPVTCCDTTSCMWAASLYQLFIIIHRGPHLYLPYPSVTSCERERVLKRYV